MPPGGPGANSRGRGGKFKKYTRGGGKHFSRDLRPLDADGNEVNMWSEGGKKKDEEEDSEDEDSSEEDSDPDDAGSSQKQASAELTREERRAQKKAAKEAAIARAKGMENDLDNLPGTDSDEEDDKAGAFANPNHTRQARSQTKAPVAGMEKATEAADKTALSRRERESLEAQQAKARYRALHEAGKTDEAKADLARLAVIREKRAAEAAQKAAEREEKEAEERRKRALIEEKEAKKREFALGKKSGKKK